MPATQTTAPNAARAATPTPTRREPTRTHTWGGAFDDERGVGFAPPLSPQAAAACSACGTRHAHDFSRVAVHERAPSAPQARFTVGAADDRFEREADAAAERVMRAPADGAVTPCSGCEAQDRDDTLRRQIESPYSADDGVVTPRAGPAEDDGEHTPVQAKPEAGGAATPVTASAGRAIQALRGGGAPLPAGVRDFMETRFDHDFGRVRVHTGGRAEAAARSLQARAFTLGRDVVFAAGQFAADSASGRRLIAHELAHVIQQGQAPRAGAPDTADAADTVRRVQWTPNADTGKSSEPWGPGRPKGSLLKAKTDGGTAITTWLPDDGTTYWCHGYTFGGWNAKGGPYSVFGETVPTVLKDDGWQPTYSCMTQPGDILAFSNAQDQVMHSGIIRSKVSASGRVDETKSELQSKWGMAALNTNSWDTNAKQYGSYRCYSKAPVTGVCERGANEK